MFFQMISACCAECYIVTFRDYQFNSILKSSATMNHIWSLTRLAGAAIAVFLGLLTPVVASERIVASIKPVHALVAGIMHGVGDPALIVDGYGSPHAASLRPSQARLLQGAEVIFWMGPDMEAFLDRPITALGSGATVVNLMATPGLTLLPIRNAGVFGGADEDVSASDEHGHGGFDTHVWLDPLNAIAMVTNIATTLAAFDPAQAQAYRDNAAELSARLAELDEEIADLLAPVRGRPFFVFHDAYHYFESRFGIEAEGAFTASPDGISGAQRVAAIVAKISATRATCIFSEAQFEPRLVTSVAEATGARTGVLDPLGASLEAGPELYFSLMRAMAQSMRACLSG
jgi:zinc transport system substrate-binding protein